MAICKPEREPLPRSESAMTLDLGFFPASRASRNKCLLFKPPSLWYFVIGELIKRVFKFQTASSLQTLLGFLPGEISHFMINAFYIIIIIMFLFYRIVRSDVPLLYVFCFAHNGLHVFYTPLPIYTVSLVAQTLENLPANWASHLAQWQKSTCQCRR